MTSRAALALLRSLLLLAPAASLLSSFKTFLPPLARPSQVCPTLLSRTHVAQSSFVPHTRRTAHPSLAISVSLLHMPRCTAIVYGLCSRLLRYLRFQHVPTRTALTNFEQRRGYIPACAACALPCPTTGSSPVCSQRLLDDASSRANTRPMSFARNAINTREDASSVARPASLAQLTPMAIVRRSSLRCSLALAKFPARSAVNCTHSAPTAILCTSAAVSLSLARVSRSPAPSALPVRREGPADATTARSKVLQTSFARCVAHRVTTSPPISARLRAPFPRTRIPVRDEAVQCCMRARQVLSPRLRTRAALTASYF